MKKVFALVLLAFVMCQCDFGSSEQPAKKSLRDLYPEKFTEEYVSDRAASLADKLCNCDPYNIYSFNNVFTKEYEELLKEVLALPDGFNEDHSEQWLEFAGELCSLNAVTDVKVTNNKAKITMDSDEYYGTDNLDLVFVDDEWVIDNLGNCSKKYMKEVIQERRKYYKSIDWLDFITDLEHTGISREDAVGLADDYKQEIETYFENYPK
jgi:hypothetical protein